MELNINTSTTLNEIKERFNKIFPYLKLEFFTHEHNKGEGSPRGEMIMSDKKINEVGGKKGTINVTDKLTVAKLESDFKTNTNLNVQVFRKSGVVWLETTNSDNWTLQEQNNHAKERE